MANEYTEYDYVAAGTIDVSELPPLDPETNKIMKDEFSTGFKLSLLYYAFIFAIPILNWFAPEFMFSRIWGGMTYSWFLTGIVAMAMAFIIAYIHTALYEKRLQKYQSSNGSSFGKSEGRDIG
ncbi:hypothetical protein [Aneurinibacillus danicus]|jgi:uncharacterized membrane protein (DUF485 family)|uniref:DUF485 domain-containing protein n=1 Tax=Aneurinibacillus danicus TaxID=267746 RepID=A0A511VFH6_9BACL|nr:hypothetical protein [Aneurinibacillus danicus]GEN36313.1 hypothetical protein ADA01nite_37730 [Aneurinibacillus danicus]